MSADAHLAEDLRAALAKIEKPETWAQGAYAKDAKGLITSITGGKGVCFCSLGAIQVLGLPGNREWSAIQALMRIVDGRPLPAFNDDPTTTHGVVVAAFQRAIAAAEARP